MMKRPGRLHGIYSTKKFLPEKKTVAYKEKPYENPLQMGLLLAQRLRVLLNGLSCIVPKRCAVKLSAFSREPKLVFQAFQAAQMLEFSEPRKSMMLQWIDAFRNLHEAGYHRKWWTSQRQMKRAREIYFPRASSVL